MKYFMGIDVGTSATKSVLFDEKGRIISTASRSYKLFQPRNGWAEQRPEDWKRAALDSLKELAGAVQAADVKGIGVSGQMHGLVALDKNDRPLCDSLIWCDQRTGREVEQIIEVLGRKKYLEYTLNAPNTSFTLSKLLWLKNNRPDVFPKIRKALLPKDYINFCLTGKYATDVSDASGTGYFDVPHRRWSKEILDAFGIDEALLPAVYESCEAIGTLTEEAAAYTGLNSDTVVAAGAGDQAAAALGNGIVGEGATSISLGSSGVVFTAVSEPVFDPQGRTHTFCHAVPDFWHIMGVTQGCGLSVSWFKHNFAPNVPYAELDAEAEKSASDGILFLPYLMGERTPYLDPDCRASFTGLSASHKLCNLYRAVLEGVCFSILDCCKVIGEAGVALRTARVGGGGANSPLWLGILSDVLKIDLYTAESAESGALGAAMLASVASGLYPTVSEADRAMNSPELAPVRPANADAPYETMYRKYGESYRALKALYKNEKGRA